MPNEFEQIDRSWPARRAAWEAHYTAKGCNPFKASRLAGKKRYKKSMPHLKEAGSVAD